MPWGAVCKTDNTSVILERWFAGRFCQESNGATVDIGSYILNVSSLLGWRGGHLGSGSYLQVRTPLCLFWAVCAGHYMYYFNIYERG